MNSIAKTISREWLDWPFFEPRHREVCEALDRFVMWGGLEYVMKDGKMMQGSPSKR